jgi:hypothetical protein
VGHIGATDVRIIADNHGHQRCLVQQLNDQIATASPGQERHPHAFTQQRSPSASRQEVPFGRSGVRSTSGIWRLVLSS